MYFPVVYSTIDEAALQEFIQLNYEIADITYCRLLARGMNDTYLIKTIDEKFVFRVYRTPWRSYSSDVEFEMDLLNHLLKNGVSVSFPIRAIKSGYIQELNAPEGTRFGVLFNYAEGKSLTLESEETAYNFGRSVAMIHSNSAGFDAKHVRPQLDLDY